MVPVHRVRLHQRHDHEATAVGERADLERHPGERRQAADGGRDRQRADPEEPAFAPRAQRQLHEPAADQHEHEPRPDRRRRDAPGEQVDDPPRHAPRPPAGLRDEAPAGLHGDGRHRRAGAGARPEDPPRRRAREEERRQRQDRDQPRQHEREPADQPAEPAANAPGAEDRELRRGRARQQVAGRDRVLELLRGDPAAPLDAETPQQRDMRRRPPEPGDADPPPIAGDREQPGAVHRARR